jgi:ABC-type transport system involved in cytochrome c biogenesis permease subunit
MALGKKEKYKFYTIITTICLLAGGMILGPVVQKFAFGELWTGIPFGWDLTDNKTLVAFVFWVAAFIGNWKKDRPYLSIIAAIVLLLIFSIPHSMFGSELDHSTGVIGQG